MAPTSAQARAGAHRSWSRTADRSARTAPARAASLARFEREVDPDGVLTEQERSRRAESAMRAYFTELSIRAAQVRRANRLARSAS